MISKATTLAQLLEDSGYEKSPSGTDIMWRLSSDSADAAVRSKIEILERKNTFHISRCIVQVDSEKLSTVLKANLKKRMTRLVGWVSFQDKHGRLRIIAEIAPPTDKPPEDRDSEAPGLTGSGTSLGWTTTISTANNMISVQLTDAFFIGEPISNWWADVSAAVAESIAPNFARSIDTRHVQEMLIPIAALPANKPHEKSKRAKSFTKDLSSIELPISLKVNHNANLTVIETSPTPLSSYGAADTSLEILEARETSPVWQTIDSKIIQRKSIRSIPAQDLTDRDLFTRVAIVPGLHVPKRTERLQSYLESSKPRSLLTLTGAIQVAKDEGRDRDKLDLLSDLLRYVSKTYGPIDSLAPLVRIVPEVLGDSWAAIDPEMAYKAWSAALERTNSNPRIHQKMSHLARMTGNMVRELDAILALSKHERRKPQLSVIGSRLVSLIHSHPDLATESPIDILEALERLSGSLPEHVPLAIATANQLRQSGKHHQALSLLDCLLSNTASTMSGIELAETNAAIARIWRYDEQNNALATARYIQATTEPSTPDDKLLEEAEIFFAATKYESQLRRVLRLRASSSANSDGLLALERSAKYAADGSNFEEALNDILQLISNGRIQEWYLDVLEHFLSLDGAGLESIASALSNIDFQQLPRDSMIRWRLAAGRIAIRTKNQTNLGLRELTHPIIIPHLTEGESSFICNLLRSSAHKDPLSAFISSRLSFCSTKEQEQLLKIAIETNLESKDGLFENAMVEISLASNESILLKDRARRLIRDGRTQILGSLIKAAESIMAGHSMLTELQDYLIQEICKSENIAFERVLDELLDGRIIDSAADDLTINQLIRGIVRSGYVTVGSKFLTYEIKKGNICIDDETIVAPILVDDPSTLAEWHNLVRMNTQSSSKRLFHAQQAYNLLLKTNDRPAYLIDVLVDLTNARKVTDEHFNLFEHLCAQKDRINVLMSAISTYIKGTNVIEREPLIHWAIRMYTARQHNSLEAAEQFVGWLADKSDMSINDLFTAGVLYYQGGSLLDGQSYLTRFLSNPECLKEPDVLVAGLDILAKCRLDRTNLATYTQTLLSWSRAGRYQDLTDKLVTRSIDWHVAGIDDLNYVFVNHFATESLDRLASIAVQILNKAERLNSGANKTIAEWRDNPAIANHQEKWRDVSATLTSDRYLGLLKRGARCDVLYLYAKLLFDDSIRHFDSIPYFEALSSENQLDARSWVPLYSLYEESHSRQKLIAHLEKIIPLVMRDSSALDSTPFNLESLKNSLRRARGANKSVLPGRFEQNVPVKQKDIDFAERAAAMQRAWNQDAPVVNVLMNETAQISESGQNLASNNDASHDPNIAQDSNVNAYQGSAAMNLSPSYFANSTTSSDHNAAPPAEHSETKEITITRTDLTTPSTLPPAPTQEEKFNQIDWRHIITSRSHTPGMTEKILKMAFASEIEKHVAVQCIALLNGDMRSLDSWHWQVWRKPQSCDYSLSPSGRLPEKDNAKLYSGSLHKLLRIVVPILIKTNQHSLTAEGKLLKFGISSGAPSVEVGLDHPAIARGMLKFFKSLIDDLRIRFRDTPRLGAHVFFDLRTRSIHFDSKWQMNLPPTILTHRALDLIVNFQRGQTALLDLDPLTEIVPVIDRVRNVLTSSGMNRLRIAFGMQHKDISDQLATINREQLISLLTSVGSPSIKEILQLQKEMRLRSLRTILASSLDIIGICEGLTGKDLCDESNLSPGKILSLHPYIEDLFTVAIELSF